MLCLFLECRPHNQARNEKPEIKKNGRSYNIRPGKENGIFESSTAFSGA